MKNTAPAPEAPSQEQQNQTPAPSTQSSELTDALRAEQQGAAIESMLGIKKPKKEAAAKQDATPAAPPAPAAPANPPALAAATPPATPPPSEPGKKLNVRPAQKPTPTLAPEDVARITAATVAEFQKQSAPQPKPQTEELGEDVPDSVRRNAPVYSEMERLFPDKYKNVTKRTAQFLKEEVARAERWEEEHPGEFYNAEDEEHAEFYRKHQPRVDPEDFEEAKFELRYKQRVSRDIEPKLAEAHRTTMRLRSEPAAQAMASEISGEIISAMLPEGVKPTDDSINKWAEADPITADVATEVSKQVQPVLYSMSLLWDGVEQFDGRNESHVLARKLLTEFESELGREGADTLVDESGRSWVSLAEYAKMPEQARQRHFTTTKQNLAAYAKIRATGFVKQIAGQRREIAEDYAKKMGYSKQPVSPVTQQQPASQPSATPAHRPSPGIGGGAPTPPPAGTAPVTPSPAIDPVAKMLGL